MRFALLHTFWCVFKIFLQRFLNYPYPLTCSQTIHFLWLKVVWWSNWTIFSYDTDLYITSYFCVKNIQYIWRLHLISSRIFLYEACFFLLLKFLTPKIFKYISSKVVREAIWVIFRSDTPVILADNYTIYMFAYF